MVIDHFISKEAQGTYYTVPFLVPEGDFTRVTIAYEYEGGVVDLGLNGPGGRFLGWSGGARSLIWVGAYSSTPGYPLVEVSPGEWSILVGAYKIPDDGVTVRYTINFHAKESRWYTGDLHMHSDASDGQHDIPTLAKKAKKKGLDFIAVSNHNNYNENFNLPTVPGLTLIPAVEWTHYKGHMNFYGVAAPFDSFIANSEEEMEHVIATAKAKGAVVSVCHPKCAHCGYHWQNEDCFDLVEMWNGPMRKTNVDGLAWWHSLLLEGKKIPLIGGSDFHRERDPVRIGYPATKVYAASPGVEDILAAIVRGNAYVTASPNGVVLGLRAGGARDASATKVNQPGDYSIMGDTVPFSDGLILDISANNLGLGMVVRLVTSEGTACEFRGCGQVSRQVKIMSAWQFAYLVVVRRIFGVERIAAVSNPVYFK